MTLKPTLRITQGHWKRKHWTDNTRLTRRVIGRWILSWPWNVDQRSLKIIEISAVRKLGCGFLFAFYSNYGRICSHLWDIQCQRMAWPWRPCFVLLKLTTDRYKASRGLFATAEPLVVRNWQKIHIRRTKWTTACCATRSRTRVTAIKVSA